MSKFSKRSIEVLNTVDISLIELASQALKISPYNFSITEGFRTVKKQQEYFKQGKSQCDGINKKSKHQKGKAIDIMCYDENNKGTWDKEYYIEVAKIFKQKAKELNIKIRWGGDFKTLKDYVHFELV